MKIGFHFATTMTTRLQSTNDEMKHHHLRFFMFVRVGPKRKHNQSGLCHPHKNITSLSINQIYCMKVLFILLYVMFKMLFAAEQGRGKKAEIFQFLVMPVRKESYVHSYLLLFESLNCCWSSGLIHPHIE